MVVYDVPDTSMACLTNNYEAYRGTVIPQNLRLSDLSNDRTNVIHRKSRPNQTTNLWSWSVWNDYYVHEYYQLNNIFYTSHKLIGDKLIMFGLFHLFIDYHQHYCDFQLCVQQCMHTTNEENWAIMIACVHYYTTFVRLNYEISKSFAPVKKD